MYMMANTDFDTKQKDCVEYLEIIRDILWNKMTEV
ncbi:hypothetical protein DYY66_1715 [Candidatus Nitrosotalea sp. FS]|nr:hypothetical protein [Candidatus Nitrosotalea sp. FS]